MKQNDFHRPEQIELNGHAGTYTVNRHGIVTVSCEFGSKSAHNGSTDARTLAIFLLGELLSGRADHGTTPRALKDALPHHQKPAE
jgi:hypothetical protein